MTVQSRKTIRAGDGTTFEVEVVDRGAGQDLSLRVLDPADPTVVLVERVFGVGAEDGADAVLDQAFDLAKAQRALDSAVARLADRAAAKRKALSLLAQLR